MNDHQKVIDWYIKREEKACKKNFMHKQIFLEKLLNSPREEVVIIHDSINQIVIEASIDLKGIPIINHKTFPTDVVGACRKHFLGAD